MRETLDEAQRRQAFLWVRRLAFAGYGICPGCLQKQEVFSRRRVTPGEARARCLDCWRAER